MLLTYYQVDSESGLKNKPFEEASIYLCTYSGEIFYDPAGGSERVSLGGPIILDTEKTRESIVSPIKDKVYIVKETKLLYMYNTTNSSWDCYSGATKDDVTFHTNMEVINSLGGINAGENLDGLSINQVLKKLLYPYVEPTVSIVASPTNGGTFEKGDDKVITSVKVSITKKSEDITKIEILNGKSVLSTKTDASITNGGTFTFSVNVPVNSTNVQLTARVTDTSNKVIEAKTGYFGYVYPMYYGVCAPGDSIDSLLFKTLKKIIVGESTRTIPYTVNNQRMVFAYPKSYGNLRLIKDANNFDVTNTFTKKEVNVPGLDKTTQAYYVYTNDPSTVSSFNMTFYF